MPTKKKAAARKTAKKKPPAKTAPPKKPENKTKATAASVKDFIAKVENPVRRKDAETALAIYKAVTGMAPKMWGPSIVGYGSYHYKYDSGREGDMCAAGFSPRSSAIVFYIMGGVPGSDALWGRLGKYRLGKGCLYVNKLGDVDAGVLGEIIARSWAYMKKTYKVTA